MKLKDRLFTSLLAAGVVLAASSCSSKQNTETADTADQAAEVTEVAEVAPQPTLAQIFADEARASESATDTTYATTASGLKYLILREGSGIVPTADDTVEVHYEGTLTNGEVFDSSYQRGMPASFPLRGVIPGWTEGLQLMKEGGKAVFYIPANLAYGENGIPGTIPPNAPLIFTVELLKVAR